MFRWRFRAAWAGLMVTGVFTAGAIGYAATQPERPPSPPGQAQPGGPPRDRPPGQPRADRPFENVEGAMRTINGGLRRLRASAADPAQRDPSLQSLGRMQAAAVFAKGAIPGDHAPTPEKLEQFRRGQIKLLTLMLECETSVLDGNSGQVTALIAKMEALRDESHKAFGVGDDDEGGGAARPPGGGGGGGGGR